MIYPEILEIARFENNRKEFPPFGPMLLAAILEEKGYEVKIIKITKKNFFLDLSSYDVVAFSITASVSFDIFKSCRFLSIIDKKSQLLIAGGIHAQLFPEQTLQELDLHAVCYSAGEETILEVLNAYVAGKEFNNVSSIVYFNTNKEIIKTLESSLLNIEKYPLPARHLLPQEDVFLKGRLPDSELLLAHVLFNRGCPYKCAYCVVSETRMSYRAGEHCKKELEELKKTGIGGFAVIDDNFIVNKEKVRKICKSIETMELKWSALSRVDAIDESILSSLSEAGCIQIKLGIETGDGNLLKKMRKNTTIKQAEISLRLIKKYNISTTIMILHGFPGENRKTSERTLSFLKKNKKFIDKITMTRFVPLPGTSVHNNPIQYNLRGSHYFNGWNGDWSKFSIHHNNSHWWGTSSDFSEMSNSYFMLEKFIRDNWDC